LGLRDGPEQARLREEVRSWLAANLPPGWGTPAFRMPEGAAGRMAFARDWQRRLFEGGWAGIDWPREHGGRGAGPLETLIWREECARARAPDGIALAVGTDLVGPTLLACGSEAQRRRFLRPILTGEEVWCQGFSEPGAGSDLASLRTRGELRGERIVVTGQKIWTSFAAHADWCLLVVRTDPGSGRRAGLSMLLADMRTPGITVRPLREMTGEAWFNEVFFDGAEVPLGNVVGELHRGWDVVLATLAEERGSSAQHARLAREVELLLDLARRVRVNGRPAAEDPRIRQQLAAFATEVECLRTTAWRHAAQLAEAGRPGPEGSILKLAWSELDQRVKEAAVAMLGLAGLVPAGDPLAVDGGLWCHEWLWSRAATIYAGSSEIQRGIIASRVLGLPRGS
jgi:alkylation response protein AidB-like acyl-CoA dehydrogenase